VSLSSRAPPIEAGQRFDIARRATLLNQQLSRLVRGLVRTRGVLKMDGDSRREIRHVQRRCGQRCAGGYAAGA